MTFQKTVLVVATVLLILILTILAILLYNKAAVQYPPEIGDCPDYFTPREKDGKLLCYNTKDLGNSTCEPWYKPDLSGAGEAGLIRRCQKAKGCGWTWEGVTDKQYC